MITRIVGCCRLMALAGLLLTGCGGAATTATPPARSSEVTTPVGSPNGGSSNGESSSRLTGTGSPTSGSTEASASTTAGDPCPKSGFELTLGGTDGAMGTRQSGLVLTNCSRTKLSLSGRPEVQILGADSSVLATAEPGSIFADTPDPGPQKMAVAPGESVIALLTWRSTLQAEGAGVAGTAVRVAIQPGDDPVDLDLVVDGGDTGPIMVTAWQALEPQATG